MNIAEAIRTSENESVVHFLLTSYLESLRRGEPPHRLPESITRLPLGDDDDVRDRMRALIKELLTPAEILDAGASDVLTGALRVFGAAVYRLTLLDSPDYVHKISSNRRRPAHAV